jgi:UDP-glucose 4-epimerase
MKILVVGGAGYIGSHVCRELLDAAYKVTVFDNLSSGQKVNLFPEAEFFKGDILEPEQLIECAAGGFDALIHLAAFKAAGESMTEPGKYATNNITGTINILNAAVKLKIPRIVFSSSAAVYGEPEYLPIDEKHPVNPENFYGFTKLEIERFLSWYDKLKGIRFAALRYFNAAGYDKEGRIGGLERNPANLLPIILEVAAGKRDRIDIFGDDYDTPDGTCVRDYIHVSDLASGHLAALTYLVEKDASLTVNLGSESGLSVKEMVEAARRITGQPIPAVIAGRRPGDPAGLESSAQMAKDLMGWEAKYSDLDSLVSTTWEAYLKAFPRSEGR